MEATDWESASSGVWLRREEEKKEEKKEERLLVSRTREEEKRRVGEEAEGATTTRGGVVMRREGSRQRREEDQRRRLSGPTRLREGGSEGRAAQLEARRGGGEVKLASSERGLLAAPVARQAPSRSNNPRPTSRVIEIKGRPMEHHQLQQGGHAHQQQQHHQAELQQGHFASADSGISSLNTSTTGSRKSARHTMIH